MSAIPPTPLVCIDGSLIWFDTSEVKACFTCAAFVKCVEKWAADAKIPPPKWAEQERR